MTKHRALRAKTFRAWFAANLKESARDIAEDGADCGFPHITYINDTVRIFDRYGAEIWEMAVSDAEDMGDGNVSAMISHFRRADMLDTLDTFKNLMVWYACEKLAREMVEG